MGALHTLHVPYIIRTEEPARSAKVERLGILKLTDDDSGQFLRSVDALFSSFTMCRDIGETGECFYVLKVVCSCLNCL